MRGVIQNLWYDYVLVTRFSAHEALGMCVATSLLTTDNIIAAGVVIIYTVLAEHITLKRFKTWR